MLTALLGDLAAVDGRLSEGVTDLRWPPLTDAMVLLSSWWIKGPLFVLVALAVDVLARRGSRVVPWAAGLTLASVLAGSLASSVVKVAFERPRPPEADTGIAAVGALPDTWSFPSGHATTAFAAAVALGLCCPRLRVPALALAGGVALSRVYLGVHYAPDVLAGAALGAGIALLLVVAARRAVRLPGGGRRVLPRSGRYEGRFFPVEGGKGDPREAAGTPGRPPHATSYASGSRSSAAELMQ